jgi:phage tail-like protein
MAIDGVPNCRFYVQIDGFAQAVFTEMSGLQVETAVTEYEEGGNNGFVHRLPGRTRVSNLTLKRGVTNSNDFFKWYLDILQGKITTRNVSVVMYDVEGEQLAKWNFAKAYPVKWIGPQFAADGKNAAIETLELAHDGLIPD